MTKKQKKIVALYTCNILDNSYVSEMEEYLVPHKIPKKVINKLSKAFSLILEVNQSCFDKKKIS